MKFAIVGAGSIGCYVGGRLAAAGAEVTLVGRLRVLDAIRSHGLTLSDWKGYRNQLAAGHVRLAESSAAAADSDCVLLTVKSAATESVAQELSPVLKPGTTVISFQNGLHNAVLLRQQLKAQTVLTGMVPFNVISAGEGRFHQGSEGNLEIESHPKVQRLAPVFAQAGLPLVQHTDMVAVLWAKLLLNLNNSINALSDIPLKEELSQRDYRRCLALLQQETLELLVRAGIKPARLTPIPPGWMPYLMTTPDWLFRRLANKVLAIDPLARSSMWEDLQLGRKTEIDYLNGEVVQLAKRLGLSAPRNARMTALIRVAESGGRRRYSGTELWSELRTAV